MEKDERIAIYLLSTHMQTILQTQLQPRSSVKLDEIKNNRDQVADSKWDNHIIFQRPEFELSYLKNWFFNNNLIFCCAIKFVTKGMFLFKN